MSDARKVVGIGEARARREPGPGQVPCAGCGKPIALASTLCPYCGLHFQGSALEHAPDEGGGAASGWRRGIVAATATVAALLLLLATLLQW